MTQSVFFAIFSGLTLVTAGIVALNQNLIRAAFALFFCLFAVAGVYVTLGGDFVAMVQLMVYAGGVAILLTFGAMLTADVSQPSGSNLNFQGVWAMIGGVSFFSVLYYVLEETQWPLKGTNYLDPTTKELGKLLLKDYLLPFEVISFLLLIAMVGAVYLVLKGEQE
ncbi:MAG: hypothetical protein A2508_06325 [Candidatus Lambdaproteobacteria bacterium RIFOXYD12_FULL_49_8]|uniref:NADH-quinone oxidoreductase subunit J n=1 Tax=Candidatus Lambdaproteobacteria bacterium RIFOXYD2_FULL_50_16 TaxID=1817772 RepID=A0A1F6GGL5_9PROT|nr:MAG: hypothetical protein A2527_10570 [Candidatus Lambdaproteobacteria bacterium RIFOXYD2_FULL_50_16]OGG97556.1 MAG: hypothetical protein A2508_06325 [Candidatus Lambdaproteobacteria bacterium RIFOXYD12_FULL_49_8]